MTALLSFYVCSALSDNYILLKALKKAGQTRLHFLEKEKTYFFLAASASSAAFLASAAALSASTGV